MTDIDLCIIDLNKKANEAEWKQECENLINAFSTHGFCLVRGAENYNSDLALSLAKWFFDLDIQHKMDLATKGFNKKNANVYRGYFPVQPGNLSCKEGFEAGEENQSNNKDDVEPNPLLEDTPFPAIQGLESECSWFKQEYGKIRASMTKVADTLMEMIAFAGGASQDYFYNMFHLDTPLSTHRIIRYPRRSSDIPDHAYLDDGCGIISTGAHADSGFLTILETFGQQGLELQLDGIWRPIKPCPGLLVVNIGEQLARMSRGRFQATIHRVLDIGRDRYSMPFFYEPYCDSNINFTIPKSLLNSEVSKKEEDDIYTPFAAFLLQKLGIYAEYADLTKNLPVWMLEKYINGKNGVPNCWAKKQGEIIDGK